MGKKLPAWALIVIGLEVLLLIGVGAWALTHHRGVKQDQNKVAKIPGLTTKPLQPPKVETVAFATGLSAPTDIKNSGAANDTRLFVAEQSGKIKILDQYGAVQAQPFLDSSNKTKASGELGLLGFAFHPNFAQNGYVYVDYTDPNQNTIIARYQLNKNTGVLDPNSEKVLLKIAQPYANHKGGAMQFGPDGYLYIGMGDGGSAGDPQNRAQNTNELLGKILRIDVDHGDPYAIPASNPFAKSSSGKPEIWAYGLRNPWRISFDTKTGDLYIADVGQNQYEELDFQPASSKGGENYAWRCYEGLHEFNTQDCHPSSPYSLPVLEYNHDNHRCSITGGYVYRGKKYPALNGKYLYADYCSGEIYLTQNNGSSSWGTTLAANKNYSITTFGQDVAGELYLADAKSGTIYRVTDVANGTN